MTEAGDVGEEMKILVLDVGTSSMRGILYNCGGTKLLEEASPYCAKYLPGGQVQQDVAEWENAMWQILRLSLIHI